MNINLSPKPKQILVLGCGPAGLLVAHAAEIEGHAVNIISPKEKSFIAGAQFLHTPIPGLTLDEPDGEVTFKHFGTEEGYCKKVYNDIRIKTSWGNYPDGERAIWHLRKWYDILWERWEGRIIDGVMQSSLMAQAMRDFDYVFSTMPLNKLFPQGKFYTEQVQITNECVVPEDMIVYSGQPDVPWYRASNLFGVASVEYPAGPEVEGARRIAKPLRAEIHNVWMGRLYFFGRYGLWQKGVLVDDAFQQAWQTARALK